MPPKDSLPESEPFPRTTIYNWMEDDSVLLLRIMTLPLIQLPSASNILNWMICGIEVS